MNNFETVLEQSVIGPKKQMQNVWYVQLPLSAPTSGMQLFQLAPLTKKVRPGCHITGYRADCIKATSGWKPYPGTCSLYKRRTVSERTLVSALFISTICPIEPLIMVFVRFVRLMTLSPSLNVLGGVPHMIVYLRRIENLGIGICNNCTCIARFGV